MIKIINFDTILPVWRDQLWPDRKSEIEPVSAVAVNGQIDIEILKFTPHFFGYYNKGRLIGVNSCHRTGADELRSRGIWVHSDFRGRGIGAQLLQIVIDHANENNISFVWSMARKSAAHFYERIGFKKYGETSLYEFGPHSFVKFTLERRN